MKRRILVLALVLCMLMGLALTAHAEILYEEIDNPLIGGTYYLCVTVDGVDYFYLRATSGKSVTDTSPYSLYLTSDLDDPELQEVTLGAIADAFYMGYYVGSDIHKIYSFDAGNDDTMDTGTNSGLDINRHGFYWDGAQKQIFAMRGGEKYVLVAKMMKNLKDGTDELHMLSVPVADLDGDTPVYPMRLVKKHTHEYSDKYTSNEYSHWFECSCGDKIEMQLHQVDNWTVTKEPEIGVEGSRTGVCTVCGATAVEGIPALKDHSTVATEEATTDETAPTEEQAPATSQLSPAVIAVAAALVVLGVGILIFGTTRNKKKH